MSALIDTHPLPWRVVSGEVYGGLAVIAKNMAVVALGGKRGDQLKLGRLVIAANALAPTEGERG